METLSSLKKQSWYSFFLRGILAVCFLILLGRLVDLTVIKGKYFRSLAEGNRIRHIPITAPRGKILGKQGEILVDNRKIKLGLVFDPISGYKKVGETFGMTEYDLIDEPVREYKLGSNAGHITGYVGEVSPDELGKVDPECPEDGPRSLGTTIGRGGLEEIYNCKLTGIDGEELVEVDAFGNKVRVLGRKEPIPGTDVKTNIHVGLQNRISELMKDKKGVVVVTDAEGAILSLFSSPSYDPNIFVEKNDLISEILNDDKLPLFNRAISGSFHPGSIYKPIVAISALEEGKIEADFTFEDKGQIIIESPYGTFTYNNWYFTQLGGVEGKIGLKRALARSTDTFFYKVGELTGVDNLKLWSGRFGLDSLSGIDLPGEIQGLIPSPAWKLSVKGERWFLGNTYHMSIGQGDIALTPLGINQAILAIANGGKYCTPRIANNGELEKSKKITDQKIVKNQKSKCRDLEIERENLVLVKKGMVAACSAGGTGYTFFDFKEKHGGIDVACKTGTAEVGDGSLDTHAWFVAFAPADKPEIIVTVLVERGGEGSKIAGPIAREIFNYWFDR